MKATTQLLTALVLGAVSGVESAIPDPVLAAGTGHLYPGSDTTTDTWREDNTLLVVGAFEWTDANVFTEALRVASAYFTWRDHINSLGGICLSGSSYDTSCTDRVKVVLKLYHFEFQATQIHGPPGSLIPREAMEAINSPYLRFWDSVCIRPDDEKPHVLISPVPSDSIMLNTINGVKHAGCTDIPMLVTDGIPVYVELAGGPPNTVANFPLPDAWLSPTYSMFKARGAKKFAILGRELHPVSMGFLGALFGMVSGNGPDAEGVEVVMLRCESEQTNPNAATCKGDSDCPGDEKCVPPSMRQDSVSYQFLNVLEYLNWAEQLKKEDPDVLVMCHGTEDYYNWVEALAVSQYTPKAAFHLVMGFAGTLVELPNSPQKHWTGAGMWTRDQKGGVSGRYMGTAPEVWDLLVANDATYVTPHIPGVDTVSGGVFNWAPIALGNAVSLQMVLERSQVPRNGLPNFSLTAPHAENFKRTRYEFMHSAECGTGRDANLDIIGSATPCTNFAGGSGCPEGETCSGRPTFFGEGGYDHGALGFNLGFVPFLCQFTELENGNLMQTRVGNPSELVYPAEWDWQLTECAAGRYLDREKNLCLLCPADQYKVGTNTAESCVSCPSASTTQGALGAESIGQCICVETHVGTNGECRECGEGQTCPGGDAFQVKSGFWKGPGSYNVYKCEEGNLACAGTDGVNVDFATMSTCDEGYSGPVCGGCDADWMKTSHSLCEACDNYSPGVKAIAVIAEIVMVCILCTLELLHASALLKRNSDAAGRASAADAAAKEEASVKDGEKKALTCWGSVVEQFDELTSTALGPLLRSVLSYIQIVSLFSSITSEYTTFVNSFLRLFDFFSFDFLILGWLGLSCTVGESYYDRLIMTMLVPVIITAAVTFLAALFMKFVPMCCCKAIKQPLSEAKITRVILVTTSFVHTMVSANVMKAFVAVSYDGTDYLKADTMVEFNTDKHRQYLTGVIIYMIFFIFGYPLILISFVIFKKKALIEPVDNTGWQMRINFFTRGYRLDVFYWEGMTMIRKMLCILVTVFVDTPFLKAIYITMITAVFSAIHNYVGPFRLRILNKMEGISLACLSLISAASSLIYGSEDMGYATSNKMAGSILFVICNVIILGTYLAIFCKLLVKVRKDFGKSSLKTARNSIATA